MSLAPESAVPPSPPSQSTIVLLALAAFFSGAALRVCDGLLPRLAGDFSLTPGSAGRVVIAFSIAYGAMQLVFGPLGDRFGKARLVLVALLGCAVMALASALAPGFDALLATRVGWGMAAAGIIPLAMAWIGDAVPYEQRQATLARLLLGTLSGMMAGQLAGGLFGDSRFGWRGAFASMAAGYALIALLLFLRLRRAGGHGPAAAHARFGPQLRAVLASPWSRVVLASAMAEGIFLLGPMAYLPSMLHTRFGLTISAASGLIALYAVGGLVYALTARRIVRRFGERRMVNAGGWLMGAGFLAWLASPVVWTAGPVALLVGFGTYLYHNTLQTHATQMAPTARGTAVALFASCLFIGQAVGVSLAGFAFDHVGVAALLLPPAILLPAAGMAFAYALRRAARG
jgi:predicted MFS family arabinose efflux permease